ncbi:MAG: hypothetical protein AMQ74_00712 [Candidatus Methanofastidiosum methylothiophilum]|uniref:Transglutaminase-like domain-containing protein n=1 Tax=Candidatus Methanofastidiosum methylothiophilum TaxID=1705564 RepID=A0A150J5H7_9EURY|nr:MAG: hypothetical protein AMQ74_00712 [Candidatus Methanofastidiosum methylthiophilus]NMC75685.1 transglutaminase domain-containing protein [Candidatus Methanofastidiosa archaeon]
MGKRIFIVVFLIILSLIFSIMFIFQSEKVNIQFKSNSELKEKVNQAYIFLKDTNSVLSEKKSILLDKSSFRKELNEEDKSLLEKQNQLNLIVFSYRLYETNDPRDFIDVNDSIVKEAIDQIITPNMGQAEKVRAIFNFVRDEIKKDEKLIRNGRIDYWNYPKDILQDKKGEYEDKIILLISMLRTAGFSENDVEVVGAKLSILNSNSSDIWVELKLNGRTYLLLPREDNNYDSFNKNDIYFLYNVQEIYRFNDKKLMRL